MILGAIYTEPWRIVLLMFFISHFIQKVTFYVNPQLSQQSALWLFATVFEHAPQEKLAKAII